LIVSKRTGKNELSGRQEGRGGLFVSKRKGEE
jgi:hypothetical protein